jgi:hypothetical protein
MFLAVQQHEYIFDSALRGSRWGKLQSEHVFSSAVRMTRFLTVLSEEAVGEIKK